MSAPIVHGGGITEAAAVYGGSPQDWLDLSTGINPNPVTLPDIPTSAWHRLPDLALTLSASHAAAAYYGSGEMMPLPVPGTQSVIQILPRIADPARKVAVFAPTYGEYARVFVEAGYTVDPVSAPEDVTADHGLVILVNPNNPTGRLYPVDVVTALAQRLQASGGLLVVDEAFCDVLPGASVVPRSSEHDNLVVFRSFGKFFGLAGVRLGFVVAPEPVLSVFRQGLGPWAVSGPALVLATTLMQDDTGPVFTGIAARRAALDTVLRDAGLTICGGTPLFALVQHDRAAQVHEHLGRARILVRKFDYAPAWLRIGLAPDPEGDARLADALRLIDLS